MVNPVLHRADADDLVCITLRHDELATDELLGMDYSRELHHTQFKRNFNPEALFNMVYKVAQSNSIFLLDGILQMDASILKPNHGRLRGRGGVNKRRAAPKDHQAQTHDKKSVVRINNSDNGCGYQAIALALLKAQNPEKREWDLVQKNRVNRLVNRAMDFCQKAGLDYSNPLDVVGMEQAATYLNSIGHRLIVVDADGPTKPAYQGPGNGSPIFILLKVSLLLCCFI